MRIVFHGENAASFSDGIVELIAPGAEIALLPEPLATEAQRATFAAAEVIIGTQFNADLPRPQRLRLYHVPGAGYDAVDLAALPDAAVVCNCFGHEAAIAEYAMAALLLRQVPLADADRRLRQGDWAYWAGAAARVHASSPAGPSACSASGISARPLRRGRGRSACASTPRTAASSATRRWPTGPSCCPSYRRSGDRPISSWFRCL
jgi:hypothetical protein